MEPRDRSNNLTQWAVALHYPVMSSGTVQFSSIGRAQVSLWGQTLLDSTAVSSELWAGWGAESPVEGGALCYSWADLLSIMFAGCFHCRKGTAKAFDTCTRCHVLWCLFSFNFHPLQMGAFLEAGISVQKKLIGMAEEKCAWKSQ